MSSESSLRGRGREVLLPAEGNPFDSESSTGDDVALPDPDRLEETIPANAEGLEGGEPEELTPEELAALYPSTPEERNRVPGAGDETYEQPATTEGDDAPGDEPMNLSPDDLAALYPGDPADSEIPADTPYASEYNQPEAADYSATDTPDLTPEALAELFPEAAPDSPRPSVLDPEVEAILDEMLAREAEPGEPVAESHEDADPVTLTELFGADNPFVGEHPEAEASSVPHSLPPAEAIYAEAAFVEPDIVLESPVARPPRDAEVDEEDSLALPIADVEETDEMLKLLVTDKTIKSLWQQIEMLENRLVDDPGLSNQHIEENIKRLKAARNQLLGGRKNYEDAERLVAEVEFDLAFKAKVRHWSYTWGSGIVVYLLLWLVVIGLGGFVLSQGALSGLSLPVLRSDSAVFFTTLLVGALGGVTGALYYLWVHVARDQDFDIQHRHWYFTNPLMGLVLAVFVYLIYFAGILTVISDEPSTVGTLLLYVLAWLSGFQQNVALGLVRRAIKFFKPAEES